MRRIQCAGIVLSALALSACGSIHKTGNDVQVAAQKLVGQPAQEAMKIFGKPDSGMGPASYGSGGGMYNWNRVQTHIGPEKIFVQTGQEYAGERQTFVTIGGRGMQGIMPVGSEPIYRPTGYYTDDVIIDYFCSINVMTDKNDIITQASVVNCDEKKKK